MTKRNAKFEAEVEEARSRIKAQRPKDWQVGKCRICLEPQWKHDEDPEVDGLSYCNQCGAPWSYDR
jgi:hypothetical protein